MIYKFGVLLVSIAFLTGCASTRMIHQQYEYKRELNRLINAEMSAEEKVDHVALIFEKVLLESMDYPSSRRTYKHITTFTKDNKQTLNVLIDQVEEHMASLTVLEKLQFSGRMLRKPYVKTFRTLVPKVEKKMNRKLRQFQIFGRLISVLSLNLI